MQETELTTSTRSAIIDYINDFNGFDSEDQLEQAKAGMFDTELVQTIELHYESLEEFLADWNYSANKELTWQEQSEVRLIDDLLKLL